MKLNRMKRGMLFNECLYSLAGERLGLIMAFIATCDRAQQLLGRENASYGVLRIVDNFSIYDDELAHMVNDLCDCDPDRILTVIWSLELGDKLSQYGKEIPLFAKIENIRQMIADAVSGKRDCFPFGEAEDFIRSSISVSFV